MQLLASASALPQRLATVASPTQWLARARAAGFCQRQPKKIAPLAFLHGLSLWAFQPVVSLRLAAACIGLCTGFTVSKQAVAKRFSPAAVVFLRDALAAVMARLAQQTARVSPAALAMFRRVLVHDSTAVTLPAHLAAAFPGNANGQGQPFAVLKIQCVVDLLAEQFVQWRLTSFRVNDLAAAPDLLAVAAPGDLVVRDLGYFVLATLAALRARGAEFLSRLRMGVSVLRADGPEEFDLLGALRRQGTLDVHVRLGVAEQLPVRLVAVPVPAAVANERRRRARQNRDRRHPPSKERLLLLGWDILITSVGAEVWSAETVCRVYGLRWRIEIVFKSWKSHFHLAAVAAGDAVEVELLIWARLLLVTLLHGWLAAEAVVSGGAPLSLLKLAQWFALWGSVLLLGPLAVEFVRPWREQARYHCRYERRRKRFNYVEKLQMLG